MKVSFPNMGNSWPAFKTFFECMGAEVILPDPTNRNDVKIGVKHSPEFVCFPFKTTLGDFVNAIEKGADTLVMAIDPYTETLIQDALNKARKGRTTIIIAHRLSTIKNADYIIVLSSENKGIVEQGNHDELLAVNGKYKRLLEMQRRDVDL